MLKVSECFLSQQGEGRFMGCDAVFLRLSKCNLTCGGRRTVQTKELDNGATWRCDTIETWIQGREYTEDALLKEWESFGWISALANGAHLVVTGGEPLLQQDQILPFLNRLTEIVRIEGGPLFVEMETNGTILPTSDLAPMIHQYNVSPKLSNSGMDKSKRVNTQAIQWFNTIENSIFKFVVVNEQDVQESLLEWVEPFGLQREKVWLMPGASTPESLKQLSPAVREWCTRYEFVFSDRGHILLGLR